MFGGEAQTLKREDSEGDKKDREEDRIMGENGDRLLRYRDGW